MQLQAAKGANKKVKRFKHAANNATRKRADGSTLSDDALVSGYAFAAIYHQDC